MIIIIVTKLHLACYFMYFIDIHINEFNEITGQVLFGHDDDDALTCEN